MGTWKQRLQGAAGSACGFPEEGHVVGVAAKACDILMHPLQGLELIQESQVLCVWVVLAVRKVRQMQEAHHAESVSDGNNDDIGIFLHEIEAIEHRVNGSACLESSAMNPYHNRLFPARRVIRLPYIQIQAVFIHIVKGARFQLSVTIGAFRIVIGLIYTIVRNNIHRSFPTQVAHRLLADIRNASEDRDVLRLSTDECAVDTLHSYRRVVVAVSNRLIFAAVHFVKFLSNVT